MPGVSDLSVHVSGFFFFGRRRRDMSPRAPDLQAPETLPVSNQGTHETSQVVAVTPDSHSQHGGDQRGYVFITACGSDALSSLEVKSRSWLWGFLLVFFFCCYYNLSQANTSCEVWQAGCGQGNGISAREPELWMWQPGFGWQTSGECWVLAASLLIKLI